MLEFFIFCHFYKELLCITNNFEEYPPCYGLENKCVVCPVNEVTLQIVLQEIIIWCYCVTIIFSSFLHSVFACFLYLLITAKVKIHHPPRTYTHPFISSSETFTRKGFETTHMMNSMDHQKASLAEHSKSFAQNFHFS